MTATKSLVFFCNGIEIHEQEFSVVKHGEVLPVEPRAFRVLLYLLRNPQRLITKDELLRSVWDDAAVTENSLARAILKLRQCLGDDARSPQYIETVATVGYRWLCPVEHSKNPTTVSAGHGPAVAEKPNLTEIFTRMAVSTAEAAGKVNQRPLGTGMARDAEDRLGDADNWQVGSESKHGSSEVAVQPAKTYSRLPWMIALALFLIALGTVAAFYLHTDPPTARRVKAQIPLPESESVNFGLSPDGKFLNFSSCEAFACKIWIRPVDSLEMQLVGDGHGSVTWSPDSKWFAFSSADKLYKMSPTGGSPVFLANTPQGYSGGVWLDSGIIVITSGLPYRGLYSVPDSGGVLSKFSDQTGGYVSWLPGGRFLYSNNDGVFVYSLKENKPVSLIPGIRGATYVPPARFGLRGHLVFLRNGALLAQDFDPDKLQVYGNPIHILTSGGDPGGAYINGVAASRNGVLAFRSGNLSRVALTWLDRSGNKLGIVSEPFNMSTNPTIRLSPDDSKAIVEVSGSNGRRDLWIADLIRRTLSRFTFDGAVGGLWSPDGHKILWDDQDSHNYMKAADGSGDSELLYKNPNCPTCLLFDWSRDGKFTSFATFNGGKANILLAPIDGNRKPFQYREVGFNNFYGMFSPDHRWLAYTSDESGQNQIYIESIPAGKQRWQVSTEGGNWPIWRRDGKELFYRQDTTIVSVPIHPTDNGLEIGKPQSLFTVPPFSRFQVSRDGQRFLIALPVESAHASEQITLDTDWRAGIVESK